MGRCVHLDASGQPCGRPTSEEEFFCPLHGGCGKPGFQWAAWRKLVFRVAAAVLLFLFAVQFYLLLKAALD